MPEMPDDGTWLREIVEPLLHKYAALAERVGELGRLEKGGQAVFLAIPLTSTSYDGNDTIAVGRVTIDTSAVFGAPVGIRAALLFVRCLWATPASTSTLAVTWTGGSLNVNQLLADTANLQSMQAMVKCDASGDFDVVVAGANATNVVIRILGYWL